MRRIHVCTTPGCAQIAPCPTHSRPANAPWTPDRDHKTHMRQRRELVKTQGPICQRCGWAGLSDGAGLHMHHVSPTQVTLLCRDCHKTLDTHAR